MHSVELTCTLGGSDMKIGLNATTDLIATYESVASSLTESGTIVSGALERKAGNSLRKLT